MKYVSTVVALAVVAGNAQAFEFCDSPGALAEHRREVDTQWAAFTSKRIDQVERFHSSLVARHETGRLSDALLARFFSAFQVQDAYAEPLILEWARKYPDSAAPWLALAHYYAAVGFAARGGEFADRTSDAQFLAMGAAFRKALYALEMADKRMKKHSLSDSMRIWLGATAKAPRPTPQEIYRAALKANPETLQVRIRYVRASAPKWGGSESQLLSIIDDAKSLAAEDRRYIEYLVVQEMGATMEWKGENAKAVELYRRSVPMCPGLDRSLESLMKLQARTNDFEGVIASTTLYLERYPRDGAALTWRGWARQELKRYPEAFADFEKATRVAHGHAFLNLAWYYETGNVVPRDIHKALDLYLIADSHGVKDARARAEKLSRTTGIPLK